MAMFEAPVSRRGVMAGAMAGGLLASAQIAVARPATPLDLRSPESRLRAYMLMRGALDERLIVSCITCQYFGVIDTALTPFYDLMAVTFARYRRASTGGYEAVTFEIEYFIDRETGDVLDQWRNPYSGQIVTARHVASVPQKYTIGPDTRIGLPPANLYPGSHMSRELPFIEVIGEDAWARETSNASMPTAEGKPTVYNEVVTFHAKIAELTDPSVTRIHTDTEYLGVSSFRPWQAMGDRQGHMVGYGFGAANVSLADLPPKWVAITRRLHPEALTHPEAYLEPLWRAT